MNIQKQSVGIDIAKDKFDVCFSVMDDKQKVTVKSTRRFANTTKGFTDFDAWVNKFTQAGISIAFVVEATGVYYEQLAWHLFDQGAHVSVVLPNKARKYAESLGIKSKNDKIDAKGLSRMAAEQRLERWQPLSPELQCLRALTREMEGLHHIKTVVNNQLHALQHSKQVNKPTLKRLQQHIALLDKQVKAIEKEIKERVGKDAALKDKVEKITKAKGLGLLSVVTVIAETNGFALIKNQRQLVSFAGYDVVENQSGKRTGKTKISKKGNSHIRRILHMPAFNAVRLEEPACKTLYERLIAKGKTKMQAYVAVQKKLLVLIYTLWKKNEGYDPKAYVRENGISGNEEPKLLFSLGCEADITKKVVPVKTETTQDELPCKESPEVLFSLLQS
jgi:transposase